MKALTWITLLALLVAAPSTAMPHEQCGKAECAAVKAKIRAVEDKMRAGYTRAQGARYERQLRRLRDRRYRVCR